MHAVPVAALVIAIGLLGAVPAAEASSSGGKVKDGPAGIPFTCSDGRALRVVYGRGGPRDEAELRFAGGESHHLKLARGMAGNRYAGELDGGRMLVWTSNAGTGWLSEMSPDGSEDRQLATCNRAGWGDTAAETTEPHADESHKAAH